MYNYVQSKPEGRILIVMTKGRLILENGNLIEGRGFGKKGTKAGELVFHTAMTGYEDVIKDPASSGKIISFSYPLIGNYGISDDYANCDNINTVGIVTGNVCFTPSHRTCKMSLPEWIEKIGLIGVDGIDTRNLTKILRDKPLKCVITTEDISRDEALSILSDYKISDISPGVSEIIKIGATGDKVNILDLGSGLSLAKSLSYMNWDITVYPSNTSAVALTENTPAGIIISDGPSSAGFSDMSDIIEQLKILMTGKIPVFGISQGHILMAKASGLEIIEKSHRSFSQGVIDKESGLSYITHQNRGLCVKENKDAIVTHINLNDNTIEGLKYRKGPFFSVQFQPECGENAGDTVYLFDRFQSLMKGHKG